MCFFALLYRMVNDYPLIVAANRDEFLDRPGTEPFEIRPGIIAGQDPRGGGTWLGVNRRGMIVAVTNRHDLAAPPRPDARSRGLLCLELLELERAAEVERALREQFAGHTYNEFNLIAADRENAFAITSTPSPHSRGRLCHSLLPGLHVVANTLPDSLEDPKVARGMALFKAAGLTPPLLRRMKIDDVLRELERICADHGTSPDDAICVHAQDRGTLSSAIIAIHRSDAARHRYLYAGGSPCVTAYQERLEVRG
jgi:uncharacterized protein with NRDE domain